MIEIAEHERPKFDKCCGWYSTTRKGLITKMFHDERQMNPDIYNEACEVVKNVIITGQPTIGGWM